MTSLCLSSSSHCTNNTHANLLNWLSVLALGSLLSWVVGAAVTASIVSIESAMMTGELNAFVVLPFAFITVASVIFPVALVAGVALTTVAALASRQLSRGHHNLVIASMGALMGLTSELWIRATVTELSGDNSLHGIAVIAGALTGLSIAKLVKRFRSRAVITQA